MKKLLAVGVIVLFLGLTNAPSINANESEIIKNEDNPLDNIEITCRGPYWMDVIFRENVFHILIVNNNNESYPHRLKFYVECQNGIQLLGPLYFTGPYKLKPNHLFSYSLWDFCDFREVWCLFGFFNVYCRLEIWPEDGSYHLKTEKFPGVIFGISAIILNPEGKMIEYE